MKLTKQVAAALASAANETRYAFDGIAFGRDDEGAFACATDGKRLVWARVGDDDNAVEIPEGCDSVLVDANTVKRAGVACRKHGTISASVNGTAKLVTEGTTFESEVIEGSFPNFAPLLEKDRPIEIIFSARLLGELLVKCAAVAESEDADKFDAMVMRFQADANGNPADDSAVEISTYSGSVRALIMPVSR